MGIIKTRSLEISINPISSPVGGKSPQNWIYVRHSGFSFNAEVLIFNLNSCFRQFCAKTRLKSTFALEIAGFSAKVACRNSIHIFLGQQ